MHTKSFLPALHTKSFLASFPHFQSLGRRGKRRSGGILSHPCMAGRGALRLPAILLVLSCLVIHSEESVHDALPRSPAGAPVSPRQDKLCSCLGDAMERIGRVLRCCSCGARPSPRPA